MGKSRAWMKKLLTVSAFGFGVCMMSGGTAEAGTVAGNLDVQAEVQATCTFVTSTALNFGPYSPTGGDLDNTGTITVNCTNGATVLVAMGQGNNPLTGSTDAAPLRSMNGGTGTPLAYDLYQDAGRTLVWGNDTSSDMHVTGTGADQQLTVYGRIPGGQAVLAGTYSDAVQATITF